MGDALVSKRTCSTNVRTWVQNPGTHIKREVCTSTSALCWGQTEGCTDRWLNVIWCLPGSAFLEEVSTELGSGDPPTSVSGVHIKQKITSLCLLVLGHLLLLLDVRRLGSQARALLTVGWKPGGIREGPVPSVPL